MVEKMPVLGPLRSPPQTAGTLRSRRLRRVSQVLTLALLALSAGVCGCGDAERVEVDFSKIVATARPGERITGNPPLRVAVAAMISPRETFDIYRQLLEYLGRRLDRDVEFVQRKTYGELNELLKRGEVDLAFICSGPYATARQRYGFEPLAVPEVKSGHYYHSYLIVSQGSPFQRLEDLRGHTFAFTDPDSNTGRLVPTFWLAEQNERPETFFSNFIYTYSHDNSILAVARGLVDGAAVDSLIWEYYQEKNPAFTARTRVIKKSKPYGVPPLVASGHLPQEERTRLRQVLLDMHHDPEGEKILAELHIHRFIPLQEEWYETIRAMHQQLAELTGKPHAPQNP